MNTNARKLALLRHLLRAARRNASYLPPSRRRTNSESETLKLDARAADRAALPQVAAVDHLHQSAASCASCSGSKMMMKRIRIALAILLVVPILIAGIWELRRTYVFRMPFVR